MVLALFAMLIAPYFIDWTAYKRDFETQATKIFGHPVKVGGGASLRILPLPKIIFGDLEVGKNADGTPLMSIGRFSANVELMPFLSGEVRVVDMTLEAPTLNLQVNDNGTLEWINQKNLLVDPGQVKLDKVNVTGGQIVVTGLAGGKTINLDDVNANMSARSLFGPWQMNGRGLLDGVDTLFTLSTGRLQEEKKLRVKLTAQRLDQPYELLADGQVGLEENMLSWNGDFSIDPVNPALQKLPDVPSWQPLPVKADGKFFLTPTMLEVPELNTEIGASDDPFTLKGRGSINLKDVPFFRFQIDGRQIDLDRVASMRGENEGGTLEKRIAVIRSVLEQIPVPGTDGELDFEIPAIVAGDTIIREVSATIRPFANGWEVRKLVAKLPGSTHLEANGRLGLFEDFGFNGKLLVASRQPSGFASWAVGNVDPAIRRLGSGGLEANVTFTESQTTFENMELLLDNNRLTGRLQRLGPPTLTDGTQGRPAMVAVIGGEKISLDDLRAVFALTGNDEIARFNSHDMDITLQAGELSGFDLKAENVDIKFQVKDAQLSVSKLDIGSFYGSRIASSGQIADLLGRPKGNIRLEIRAENSARLLELARNRIADHPLLQALQSDPALVSNTVLNIEMDANPQETGARGRILLTGETGGTSMNSTIGFNTASDTMRDAKMDISATFENNRPETLLQQVGILEPAVDILGIHEDLKGPLTISVESVGTMAEGLSSIVSAATPDATVSARGLYFPKSESSQAGVNVIADSFELDITSGFENLTPYLVKFGLDPVQFAEAPEGNMPFSLEMHVEGSPAEMKLENIRAVLAGNNLTGNLSYADGEAGRKLLEGALSTDKLSMAAIAAAAYGAGGDEIGGEIKRQIGEFSDDWSALEFGAPVFAGKDANLDITASIVHSGFGFPLENARLELVMRDGDIDLNNFMAGMFGGQVSGNLSMKNGEGTGLLKGQFQADDIVASALLKTAGAKPFLDGRLRFNGTVESSGRSAQALANSLSGSGVIVVEDGKINGVSTGGLGKLLASTDIEGFEVSRASVDPLVEEIFLSGSMPFSSEPVAYSITRGKLQLRNIVRKETGYEARFGAEVSLVSGEIDANLVLEIDPGKDTVTGASSDVAFNWSGTVEAPELATDSQALQGFLSIRAFEAEERRVELLQASIMEKQRLRQDIVKTNTRINYRETIRQEEMRLQEEARKAEEARLKEVARRAEEARIAEQRKQEEEAAKLEAERRAEEIRQAEQVRNEALKADEVRREKLEAPAPVKPGLFDNIEKLLQPQTQF